MPASSSPRLSILVVSFNTRAMTLACLDSVVAETRDVTHEIIVVDNASTDGSAAAIATHAAAPRLIASPDNLGFARANNVAAAAARGDYLLLLNPDTVVLDRAIDRLVAFAERTPAAGIWGGRTMFGDGSPNRSSAWGRMTPWRLLCRASGLTGLFPNSSLCNGEAIGGWDRSGERDVDIVSGCFLLIRRDLWQRLGGFDPLFFMYGEEADLCLRARVLGASPRATGLATIIHHGGASEATRDGKMVRLLAAKASLIQRHFAPATRSLGLALHAAWPLSRALVLGCAGHALRRPHMRDAARTWWRIWQRRREWIAGYGALPVPAPAVDAARADQLSTAG